MPIRRTPTLRWRGEVQQLLRSNRDQVPERGVAQATRRTEPEYGQQLRGVGRRKQAAPTPPALALYSARQHSREKGLLAYTDCFRRSRRPDRAATYGPRL